VREVGDCRQPGGALVSTAPGRQILKKTLKTHQVERPNGMLNCPFPIFQFVLAVPNRFYTFATHFKINN